ncbi:MAG: hypothetical protein HYZ18_04280 [Pseudogulbenkiania sp.]|nr:hypothetical protein [Pseudogulbenkiania sp.]
MAASTNQFAKTMKANVSGSRTTTARTTHNGGFVPRILVRRSQLNAASNPAPMAKHMAAIGFQKFSYIGTVHQEQSYQNGLYRRHR